MDVTKYVILGGYLGLCSGRETVTMGQEDGERERKKLTRYKTPFCVAELDTVGEHMLNMKMLLHLKLPITNFPEGQRQSWESDTARWQ